MVSVSSIAAASYCTSGSFGSAIELAEQTSDLNLGQVRPPVSDPNFPRQDLELQVDQDTADNAFVDVELDDNGYLSVPISVIERQDAAATNGEADCPAAEANCSCCVQNCCSPAMQNVTLAGTPADASNATKTTSTNLKPGPEIIQSQLVAAGFECGNVNCAHFYQSLGPVLQMADMTAGYVDHMDYY